MTTYLGTYCHDCAVISFPFFCFNRMEDYKNTGCLMNLRTKIKIDLEHKLKAGSYAQTSSLSFFIFFVASILTFPASLVHVMETRLICLMICHKKKEQTSL